MARSVFVSLLLLLSVAGSARAGECLHLSDETCAACVRGLLANDAVMQAWVDYETEPTADRRARDLGTCDLHCDRACLFETPIRVLLEAQDTDRAARLLAGLGPYRSCAETHLPALALLEQRYAESAAPMRAAIRQVVARLHTEGRGFAAVAKPCADRLAAWLAASDGELRDAIACGLAKVGVWETDPPWLETLRVMPAVERCLLADWYRLPTVVGGYLSRPKARGLRYLSDEALRRCRNAVFARHGRRFKDPALQSFFDAQPWYQASDAYSDARLQRNDRHNLRAFVEEEKRRATKQP
jgi:hypothetical protein